MARKQPNGTGERPRHNKTKRRWEARYELPAGPDGVRRRRLVTGATAADVRKAVQTALDALDQGLSAPDDRALVTDFIAWWRDEVLPGEGLAPSTERWYGHMLDAYVVPGVGRKTLAGRNAMTVHDVEALTAALDRRGLSPRVQGGTRVVLSKVLHAAQQRGLVARNVARLAKPPGDRGEQRSIKALSVPDARRLIDAVAGTRWAPAVTLQVTTGLRPQELLALQWDDLKLDKRAPELAVRRALSHVGGATLKAPKRPRSYRTVPIRPDVVPALRAWRKIQAAEQLAAGELYSSEWPGLVFTNELGLPIRVDTYRHTLRRLIEEHNDRELEDWKKVDGAHASKPIPLPVVPPHALRHTFATTLLEQGTPIHHVAELLGDTVAVVESTYSHVLRTKHEVTGALDGMFG